MILKEEMKARSGSYDNDPWGSARNSRSGSKEALHNMGYSNTVNGCKWSTLPPSQPKIFYSIGMVSGVSLIQYYCRLKGNTGLCMLFSCLD